MHRDSWELGRVEIIAHRGTPREFPENSLPGFARALDLGADGIELDVQLTADGVPVVHHDAAVHIGTGRTVGNGYRIQDMTARELRGHVLAPGVPIPTLAETLAEVGDRGIVYVEIKASNAEREVLDCIGASRTACAVHSFDHRVALRTSRILAEDVDGEGSATPTGILLASYLIDPANALQAARARDYWQQWDLIDADLVARVHAAGGRVIAWTVNDPVVGRQLRHLGVDAICTDICGVLQEALQNEGA